MKFRFPLRFSGLVSKQFAGNVQIDNAGPDVLYLYQGIEFTYLSLIDSAMFLFYSPNCLPQG